MYFVSPPFGSYVQIPNTTSIKGSYTLYAREGLIRQILYTLRYIPKYKGWVNKIGLRNKGIDWAIQDYSVCKQKDRTVYSISVMQANEVKKLIEKIPEEMNIEINISCPNVAKNNSLMKNLNGFLKSKRKWCILKLSPHSSYEIIDFYYNIGFRQFHCCNTIPVPEGGLSGPAIKPYSRKLIEYINTKYKDVEIIAGGGIHTKEDVDEYSKIGAKHFSFSTLLFHPFKFTNFYWKVIRF